MRHNRASLSAHYPWVKTQSFSRAEFLRDRGRGKTESEARDSLLAYIPATSGGTLSSLRSNSRGFALILVLILMTLLFIYTASFSFMAAIGTKDSLAVSNEAKALAAADSGLQVGLEMIRQGLEMPTAANARWNLIESGGGHNVCFKVYSNGTDPGNATIILRSYSEVGPCSEQDNVAQILAARVLQGTVNPDSQTLASWQEVLP